ncbi:proton-conducting transporter transmembrane domain-containing protein [Thiovibrio sp. JS02]
MLPDTIPAGLSLFLLSLFLLTGGGILPLLLPRRSAFVHAAGAAGGLLGSMCGAAASLLVLRQGGELVFSLPWATAGITLSLHLDSLAAFFLLPLFVVCLCAAVYAPSYLRAAAAGPRTALHWFFFNILIVSMALVITSANGLQFLIAWEAMSLSSFFLVIFEYNEDRVRRAGWLYLLATHIGTAFLFVFFLEAGRLGGSLDFSAFSALGALPPRTTLLFFFLILIGFGAKAGLFPLHVWLPDAHPAAPSHVSAVMSGVMIKTAVYGFLRLLTFLPPLPPWCGILVMGLGLAGALFGIIMAVLQNDIKRSLAYSTVENIGLIFLGIGLWLHAANSGYGTVAALALTGALLHVWNHALFKGLLFFGAGSILHAAGSRTLSHLGGLLARMPVTGALFILAGAAVAALPPLNGFVSEWFLYMGIFTMGQSATGGSAIFFLLLAALLGLVGGLVLLALSRLAGLALLGEPRRERTAQSREAAWPMLAAMTALAGFCLSIGLFPSLPIQATAKAMAVLDTTGSLPAQGIGATLPFTGNWAMAGGLLLALTIFTCLVRHRRRRTKKIPTWGCGFLRPTPRMTYMAGGYSQLAQENFFCACLHPEAEESRANGLFPATASFAQHSEDPILRRGFGPLFSLLAERAYLFRKLQAGQLNVYLFYIFISTTLLLGWVMFQP